MRLVIIESPLAPKNGRTVEQNIAYAKRCMLDSLMRGEAPLVSHLLYPLVLNDNILEERELGIEAGLAWCKRSDCTVVYEDYGISDGMRRGIARAIEAGRIVEHRSIGRSIDAGSSK